MFNVGAEADDADGGDASVDQDEGAVNVAVMEQAQDAAPRRCLKSGKKSVTVTEPRVKRGKGMKRDAEEEPEKKDNAATKVAPKKRGRKAAATVAEKKEEDTEKKPDVKKAGKVTADKEEEKEDN